MIRRVRSWCETVTAHGAEEGFWMGFVRQFFDSARVCGILLRVLRRVLTGAKSRFGVMIFCGGCGFGCGCG